MNLKGLIDFCKTHAILLASGGVSLAAIALCVLLMTSDTVAKELKKTLDTSGASSIQSLKMSPKNPAVIEAEKQRGRAFDKEFNDTITEARKTNRREPLMQGVFPKSARDSMRFDFRDAYVTELKRLPIDLGGGTVPSAADIAEERQNVEELWKIEQEKKAESTTTAQETGERAPPAPAAPAAARDEGANPYSSVGPRGGRPSARGGFAPDMAASNLPAEPKYDATLRARVNRARSIRCYYDEELTFQSCLSREDQQPPTLEDMWYSQVVLWVQQDVVRAIAALNAEFAEAVKSGDAYVQHVPVKRLLAVRVLGYQKTDNGMIPFPSLVDAPYLAEAAQKPSFTGKKSNDQYDVVRFELAAIVDQREVLKLIDRLTKANYYKCINVSYDKVDRDNDEQKLGYLYGTAPVVAVRLSFEGYLFRQVFDDIKPPSVAAAISGQPLEGAVQP